MAKNFITDRTEYLQISGASEKFFNHYSPDKTQIPSSWNKFPTKENPNTRYKFTSMEVTYSQD